MKYSLRGLMIVAILGPAAIAGSYFVTRWLMDGNLHRREFLLVLRQLRPHEILHPRPDGDPRAYPRVADG